MKINAISFSVVKNEADIIEAFIRHNLNYVDRMVIADNLSTDNTIKILYSLKKEGLPIDIFNDPDPAHSQCKKITSLYFMYAEQHDLNHVFFLDADEFLCGDINFIDKPLPPGSVYNIPLKTYIMGNPNPSEKNALLNMRRCFKMDNATLKVSLRHDPSSYRRTVIADGNHYVLRDGSVVDAQPADLFLAHFPFRSKNQFLSKIIMGRIGLALYSAKDELIGGHWIAHFNFLKEHEFAPSDSELMEHLYQTSDMDVFLEQFGEYDPIPVSFDLKYDHWIKPVNILHSVLISYLRTLGL